MKKAKTTILRSLSALAAFAFLLVPSVAFAQEQQTQAQTSVNNGLSCGANLKISVSGESCELDGTGEAVSERIDAIITQAINILSLVVGVTAVVMIIIGGFRYITSGGDSGNVTSAKNTILYAIIGLVVVALAQVIVRFVVLRATTVAGGNGAAID